MGRIVITAGPVAKGLSVTKQLSVTSIDKQNATISLTPSSTRIDSFVNTYLPIEITLQPISITGGTPLPFISAPFGTQFVYTDGECPQPTLTYPPRYGYEDFNIQNNPLSSFTVAYKSSAVVSNPCIPTLRYIGNKYFNASESTFPQIMFERHSSSMKISPIPPSLKKGTPSSDINITVADSDKPPHNDLGPTGTVNLAIRSDKELLTCGAEKDYTINVDPQCTRFLQLTADGKANFQITFNTGPHSNVRFEVTYDGDNNFARSSTNPTISSSFPVEKHASSMMISAISSPITKGTPSSDITITVTDGDNAAPPHSLTPTGIVRLTVQNNNRKFTCGRDYSIKLKAEDGSYSDINCSNSLTLTSDGKAIFQITFLTGSQSNVSFKVTYDGDSNFAPPKINPTKSDSFNVK
jgi:hypothetical protein